MYGLLHETDVMTVQFRDFQLQMRRVAAQIKTLLFVDVMSKVGMLMAKGVICLLTLHLNSTLK